MVIYANFIGNFSTDEAGRLKILGSSLSVLYTVITLLCSSSSTFAHLVSKNVSDIEL